jgi:hypothetical protein
MAGSNPGKTGGPQGVPRNGSPGRGFASMDPERQAEVDPHLQQAAAVKRPGPREAAKTDAPPISRRSTASEEGTRS